ncbi:MAG: hypothetical protein Aurels2KO_34050 [Aureliella sp.]
MSVATLIRQQLLPELRFAWSGRRFWIIASQVARRAPWCRKAIGYIYKLVTLDAHSINLARPRCAW